MSTEARAARRQDGMRQAARSMIDRSVLGTIVEAEPPEASPGIVTGRDFLELVADGRDSDTPVADRFTPEATCAAPDWSLERAGRAMVEGGVRHLVVPDGARTAGLLSLRDIVRGLIEQREQRPTIQIGEAMNRDLVTMHSEQTLHEAAQRMVEHDLAAALVEPSGSLSAPRLVTERDLVQLMAAGDDGRAARVGNHLRARGTTFSAPDWSLKQAAEAMIKGGFHNVVVVDSSGPIGIISMRDIVGRWLD